MKQRRLGDVLTRRRFLETSTAALAGATLLSQVAVADPRSADAVLPAGMDREATSILTLNSKRSQVSLEGIWRFMPAVAGEADPRKVGWAYINVPGSWGGSQGLSFDFVALGCGPRWKNYEGAMVVSAWYERRVHIPAEWQRRVISLHLDRVCTDAIVYFDGGECGRVSWPWGSVDITRAVTPGKTVEVRVLMAAIADSQMVGHFWQNAFMAVTYSAAKLAMRGLTGSVHLESRFSEAHVSDVFVRTSTRQKNCAGRGPYRCQASSAHFVADMINEKCGIEKCFTADLAVDANPTQTVSVSCPGEPHLCGTWISPTFTPSG
jgi:beta-galactosidase